MEKQIIKHGDKFAARYKKWYHLRWRYIGLSYTWNSINEYVLTNTYDKALDKIINWFPETIIISKHI